LTFDAPELYHASDYTTKPVKLRPLISIRIEVFLVDDFKISSGIRIVLYPYLTVCAG
jgi:hypothetical protein